MHIFIFLAAFISCIFFRSDLISLEQLSQPLVKTTLSQLTDGLSLEEKVGQLLMVHFNGETDNEDAKTLIQKAHVGGIIYYNWANGLHSPSQVKQLSKSLQTLAQQNLHPIPLLIAVDQEGGRVARLREGFTKVPSNQELAATNRQSIEQYAAIVGKELLSVGININLAPVIDINSNPNNPVIGNRSFASTPQDVIDCAKLALKGYHSAGIATTLKHFPGHGDVEIDSHYDLPRIKKSREELKQNELLPFIQLAADTDAIMTAHLLVDALDPVNCTTLSRDSLDFLRKEANFQGVIVSDSLVMEGLLKTCSSLEEAAIRSFNAGCDIILLGGKQLIGDKKGFEISVDDVLRIHQAFVNAVKEGRISELRVNQSVNRILALKIH